MNLHLFHYVAESSKFLACCVFIVALDQVLPLLLYPILFKLVAGCVDSAATLDFSLQRSSMVAELTFCEKMRVLNFFLFLFIQKKLEQFTLI